MNEAFNFLSNAGGGLESVSLTGPSIANYHLSGLRVYDSPYGQKPLINGILLFDDNENQITPPNIKITTENSEKEYASEYAELKIKSVSGNVLSGMNHEGENDVYAYIPPDKKAEYIEGLNVYR